MGRIAWELRTCVGTWKRLQMSLGVAFVLVLHEARCAIATAADNMDGEGGGLTGGPRWLLRPWPKTAANLQIPRVIHRLDKAVTPAWNPYEDSWRRLNPEWELRIWNDLTCLEFVEREFPEYFDTYQRLSRNIERSDFFRYMVVLRMGGVYTDSDVECRKPLDDIIQPSDALVAGWEAEFPNATIARVSEYTRKRQALQWTFAAAPGHPVLRDVCEHIKRHADKQLSDDEHYDVLERTGPGPWTDAIMKHTHLYQPSQLEVAWRVRVLPIVQMGIYPYRQDDWTPGFPEAFVLHKFQGTWKTENQAQLHNLSAGDTKRPRRQGHLYRPGFVAIEQGARVKMEELLPFERSDKQHYPVSVTWQPPFTMIVDLIGQEGNVQAGSDVGAMLTRWGMWQPSVKHRKPSVLEALIGGLESTGNQDNVMLDVGAGIGYYSLAAAARGHKSIATELFAASRALFEASIRHNGFDRAISLHKVALGSRTEEICIGLDTQMDLEARHGYGLPDLHDMALQADKCLNRGERIRGARLVPHDVDVGAIRISASGWEGWILEGLQELWTQKGRVPPAVIVLELYPEALAQKGYVGGTATILDTLHAAGYADILHSGPGCNARQKAAYQHLPGVERQDKDMEEHTWCRLHPAYFSKVMNSSLYGDGQPENILFTRKERAVVK